MKLNYLLILVFFMALQCSCRKKNNQGRITLINLRKDTTISIKTNQSSPTTLKLFVEKPLGTSFIIDNARLNPEVSRDTIVEDRYISDFSIRVRMLQTTSHMQENDSSSKSGLTIKIKYLLL